jgi:hypothetical protein
MSMIQYYLCVPAALVPTSVRTPQVLAWIHEQHRRAFEDVWDPARLAEPIERQAEQPWLCIHKHWHLLQYCLTGEAWGGDGPLALVVSGGEVVGDPDDAGLGYGPPRYVASDDVSVAADALEEYGEAGIRSRFDLKSMSKLELYGVSDSIGSDQEELNSLLIVYRLTARFWRRAADSAQGIVIVVS